MLTRERLSDTELLNLKNKTYSMTRQELEDAEDRYDVSLIEKSKNIDLSGVGVGFATAGYILAGGTLLYACSSLLYSLGFTGATFHFQLDHAWLVAKYETIPSLLHNIFLFLKGAGLGIVSIGAYKTIQSCVENTKKPPSPIVKINGKEVS